MPQHLPNDLKLRRKISENSRKISEMGGNHSPVLNSSLKIKLLVIAAKNYSKTNIKLSWHPPVLLPLLCIEGRRVIFIKVVEVI